MTNQAFRLPGEFESQQAVLLCWPGEAPALPGYDAQSVFVEVIRHILDEAAVHVNCGATGSLEPCKARLDGAGIDTSRIHFTQFADTLNWARDYGADILVDGRGGMRLIDFNFNTYGMETENGTEAVASKKIAPHQAIELGCFDIVNTALISEGGDRECNGRGVMMAIERTEVCKRNPGYTRQLVEDELVSLFKLDKMIWLPDATFDDEEVFDGILDTVDGKPVFRSLSANGHIDEMCRFADENIIVLAEVTEEEAGAPGSARITKERLDAAYDILSHATDANGRPFRIVRMPVPAPIYLEAAPGDAIHDIWQYYKDVEGIGDTLRDGTPFPAGSFTIQPALSYCNFLICNGTVLGQKYWREGMPDAIREKDAQAQAILEGLFPGRKVVMIESTALNILGGGIHCITRNVPRAD